MNNLHFLNFFDSVEDDSISVLKGLDSKTQKKISKSLKSKDKSFMMDEFATFKGYLKLNSDDIYRCVYIIEFAEVY